MFNTDRYIVAIDLGSYRIALTVAKVNGNDVQIIYYKETPSAGIRYSSVFNGTQVTGPLAKAIQDAEEELGIKIIQAVIGMPKYPVRQESNTGKIVDRGFDTDITAEDIESLKSFAQDSYPLADADKEVVYGAVAQSFSDGENFQIIEEDIVGMASDVLEGHFKIFIGKKNDLNKIDNVMNKVGIPAIRKYFTADSTAKAVLTSSEMENGVALIDFGAGCTSVSIYHGNVMRHYASIPFGGKNITDDIKTECRITEKLAENIKLAFGACMPEKLQSLSEKILIIQGNGIEQDKQLPVKYLSEIITARVEEIMMAILYEIEQSGFADRLRSGIVITGGCAQLPNLGNFIYDISGYKTRTGYPKHLFLHQGCDDILETSAATSVGLILSAKDEACLNCASTDGAFPGLSDTKDKPAKEEEYRDTIFADGDIEKIDPQADPKPKPKPRPKVKWTEKVSSFFGSLYESVNENIENEEV
ncbi:MAG: cell division protein FtsA [Bacteroidales bacterium]|nr:cell division protein FtsA [Bacteroidales bacterium]